MRRQHGLSRQRRGMVGCTNLSSTAHTCETGTNAHQLRRRQPFVATDRNIDALPPPADAAGVATAPGFSAVKPGDGVGRSTEGPRRNRTELQLAHTKREKFKLPLLTTSTSTATTGGQSWPKRRVSLGDHQLSGLSEAEYQLGAAIDDYERANKSYKNEHWYKSPVGLGSKQSVLLAALKARDPGGSGFITCRDLVATLQAPNLGLKELQARSLLADFDPQLRSDDAKLHYRSFVKQLRLPDDRGDQPGQDPIVFRQQSYVNRVRAHAAQLLEKVAAVDAATAEVAKTAVSPEWKAGKPSNGTSQSFSALPPLVHVKQSGETSPIRTDGKVQDAGLSVDRLSFEHDKLRKQQRADAKSRILLAHINRLEAFSRQQQQAIEQHESMRLAAKALHRHAHFERAFQEENRRLRVAQQQGKGLVRSPTTRMHRNASVDSMFYVEPLHSIT